jgi:hypothetical protein
LYQNNQFDDPMNTAKGLLRYSLNSSYLGAQIPNGALLLNRDGPTLLAGLAPEGPVTNEFIDDDDDGCRKGVTFFAK